MFVIFRRMIGGQYEEFASDHSMAALPRIGDKILIKIRNVDREFYVCEVAFQCTVVQIGIHDETNEDYYNCVSHQNPILVDLDPYKANLTRR